MSTHCPGCCGLSYEDVKGGLPEISHDSPPCPGCNHEAELALLRAVAEAAKYVYENYTNIPSGERAARYVAMNTLRDALAVWEKVR